VTTSHWGCDSRALYDGLPGSKRHAIVRSATTRVARWVSIIAHPFVLMPVMVVAATAHLGRSNEIVHNAGVVTLFEVIPVVILTVEQVRRGAWKNADASEPHERPILFAVSTAGILALICYLMVSRPDSILLRGTLVTLALLLVCAVITRWIKVSLHVTAATLTATALVIVGSPVGWIVTGVLPILCWSRLVLGRHKPIEIVVGLGLGIVTGVAMAVG
jgi:hypothetical protein